VEEEDEIHRRAGGASVVDNGSKAAMPVGGSGNNTRGKIKRAEPAGDASAVDEVCKAGKEARKMKKAAARGCCGEGLVGKNPTVLLMERRSHGGTLRCDTIVEYLGDVFAKTAARFGSAFSE